MGNRKALKGDRETLKNDGLALNGSKEVLKGVEDALKGDKKSMVCVNIVLEFGLLLVKNSCNMCGHL